MLIQNSTNSFWLSHVISSFYLTFIILSYIFLQRFLFLDQLSFPLFPSYHLLLTLPPPQIESICAPVESGNGGTGIRELILIFIVWAWHSHRRESVSRTVHRCGSGSGGQRRSKARPKYWAGSSASTRPLWKKLANWFSSSWNGHDRSPPTPSCHDTTTTSTLHWRITPPSSRSTSK